MTASALDGYLAGYAASGQAPAGYAARRPLASVRALRALAELPSYYCQPSATPAGESLRASLSGRRAGLPVGLLGVGVLDVSAGLPQYLRGRSRQALRTGVNHARDEKLTVRPLDLDEVAHFRTLLAPSVHERGRLEARDEAVQSWRAVIGPDERVLCVSVVTRDGSWACLERHVAFEPAPLRSPSRYLLHLEVLRELGDGGVRFLVDPTSPGALPAGLQHYQARLGFVTARVRVL